jgi:hypothetical protein
MTEPKYTAQNILAGWDALQERNKKRRRFPTIINELHALSNPSFRNSAAYRNNQAYISTLGDADFTDYSRRMNMLAKEEQAELDAMFMGRMTDAGIQNVGEFDAWVADQGSYVAGKRDKFFNMWDKRMDTMREQEKYGMDLEDREQEQLEKVAKKKEEERYDILVREASRKLRRVQDGEGFTDNDGAQVMPIPPGLTFAAQQEILNRGMKQAEMMGLDPDEFAKRFNNLIINAPATKQVLDTQTGKMVFRSDREIANEPDRYTPLQTDRGKLSTSTELAAIMALSELQNVSQADGMKALQLMEELGPLGAMQQNPALAPIIQQIAIKMKQNQDWFMQIFGQSMQNAAGSGELKFE